MPWDELDAIVASNLRDSGLSPRPDTHVGALAAAFYVTLAVILFLAALPVIGFCVAGLIP